MGKLTDALKKAASERLARIKKLDGQNEVEYQFVAKKTIESKIDPRIVSFYEPDSPVAEQYRVLRTNLQSLPGSKPVKTITITSSIHGEGKSVSAVNLAIAMARDLNEKNILLVDADLRRPKISSYLGIAHELGLSDLIANGSPIEEALLNIGIDNLTIVTAGKQVKNPAELLGSLKFKNLLSQFKAKYDYIIFDAPPIIPVTDAGLIGAQTDGVIMVIQASRTPRGVVKHGENLLTQAQTKLLGYILTNIRYHIPAYIYRYL